MTLKFSAVFFSMAIGFGLACPASGQDGWTALFDGKSIDKWSVKSGFATYTVEEGGVIMGKTAEGSGNSFLCPPQEYGDFELEFEVKVDDGLNSGVQIRSKLKNVDGKDSYGGRLFGPQVEIESSPGQSGWVYGEATGRGWLSPEPKMKDKASNEHSHMKNGEWNQFRVVAKGSTIKTSINGNAVADLTDEEIFETHPKGLIGLQVHGIKKGSGPYEVRWRNLRIKPLK
ncbi:3-keto-disaccharide hydrolase [Stieleria marina]